MSAANACRICDTAFHHCVVVFVMFSWCRYASWCLCFDAARACGCDCGIRRCGMTAGSSLSARRNARRSVSGSAVARRPRLVASTRRSYRAARRCADKNAFGIPAMLCAASFLCRFGKSCVQIYTCTCVRARAGATVRLFLLLIESHLVDPTTRRTPPAACPADICAHARTSAHRLRPSWPRPIRRGSGGSSLWLWTTRLGLTAPWTRSAVQRRI
jgi:hypothetical protein